MTIKGPAWLGSEITLGQLKHKEAIRFLKTLSHKAIVGFRLLSITRNTDPWEFLIIDVTVDRPQRVENDIQYEEPIALGFKPGETEPAVLPLRPDFPDLMHMSLTPRPYPNSLCLYEQPLIERRLQQTPLSFLERIRSWLAQTAVGTLHGADQPLEPLFHSEVVTLVLDREYLKTLADDFGVTSLAAFEGTNHRVIIASHGSAARRDGGQGASLIAAFVAPATVQGGAMRSAPETLDELIVALRDTGLDIVAPLCDRILRFNHAHPDDFGRTVIVLVCFPLQREADGVAETTSYRAFLINEKSGPLGVALGVLAPTDGKAAGPQFVRLLTKGAASGLNEIQVITMQTAFMLDRKLAAELSGAAPSERKITLVGAGTLGSMLAQTLVRAGNGLWTIIDDDVLLPHNIARHAITHCAVGGSKAVALANLLNDILAGEPGPAAMAIYANVIQPKTEAPKVVAAITSSDLVIDASASIAVARHLAFTRGGPRRISVFFSPSGLDIVMLCESRAPGISLMTLEAQYYRAIIDNPVLDGHLAAPPGQVYPVGSCRHASTVLSYAKASALVGLASVLLESQVESEGAAITILRMDRATGAVAHNSIVVADPISQTFEDWTICFDAAVDAELRRMRAAGLPTETGGVLIGFYDLPRKLVYVVKAMPPPPDSTQATTSFERGTNGVVDALSDISRKTQGQVGYVGEWHSHPDGAGATPSCMDVSQLVWLIDRLSIVEQPAVMIIVGEEGPSLNVGFAVD